MKRNNFLLFVMIFAMLLISSCRSARTARVTKAQIQLMQYVLNTEDLPGSGWTIEGRGWEAYDGGDGYGITYIRDKHVFITHTVVIYSTMERARQAYQEWEMEWFEVTNLQPKTTYIPLDLNDDYTSGCLQITLVDPLMDCEYLQRHNQIINFIKVNFDSRSGNNLTFDEINNILSILDKRLNEVIIDETPSGASQ